MVLVAQPYPVFLDVTGKEVMEVMAPLWFRGFRIHTVWNPPPGEEPVRQIAFPRLRGDATAPMLEYEPEKFPQSLWQGSKIAIPLRPPSSLHWNIESDLMFSLRPRGLPKIQNGSLRGLKSLPERRLFLRGLPWP